MQQPKGKDVTWYVDALLTFATMTDLESVISRQAAARPATADLVASAYDAHQRELYSFALRSSRDREAAEDLVHEAFMRLIVELDAGRPPVNVRAWLYRVIANLAISRRRRAVVAHDHLGELLDRRTDSGPERQYLEHEWRSDLDDVLGELGQDARTALLMASNGFNGLEIAEAIGRTGAATRSLMCRARLRLRERLGSMESFA
ncbi:MAG TPA: RNA polymerase sigma factor [Candidatus Limnocylindrales bacterium]|nr:RNA polymerase sigma factor [Candidatus Limnocylindrales bacterium]